MECETKINFDRHLPERSMCAPSLQREFGIYGEYIMSYEVQDCRRTHLKCLGSTCCTVELSSLRVMAGRLGDALECSYHCQ